MVCLDLTRMDDFLMNYAFYISNFFDSAYKIYFTHNIKFDYPEEADELLSNLDKPLKEVIEDIIYEKIKEVSDESADKIAFDILVQENDSTFTTLASIANEEEVDLIIAGKKISYPGSGYVVEKMLSISDLKADLLMVPETAYHQVQNILTPTDFSEDSKKAIEFGLFLKQKAGAQLDCQYVYHIPTHFFPYIPVDNLQGKMKESAEKEWNAFKEELDVEGSEGLNCSFTYDEGKNVAQSIYDHALQRNKDLIIISSKGKSALASIVMGSVASRLIKLDFHIPLLITRS